MIKFCDPSATEVVAVDGVEFRFKRVNVRTKFEIITALSSLTKDRLIDTLDELRDQLGRVIVSVIRDDEGEAVPFVDAFEEFEEFDTVKKLMVEVIRYCALTEVQRKNSDSSSGQDISVSAGSVEKPAAPDGAPAGII